MINFRMLQKLSARKSTHQRGFALVELIIAVSVMALLGVYASALIARNSEENIAEGAGAYIAAVAGAAEVHALLNFLSYETPTPIPGVAVLNAPTVAELVALGRLNPGFPSAPGSVPTRQSLAISVTPTNCPGPNCTLTTLVCTTTPVTLGGPITRFDLASTMVSAQGGRGGQSLQNNGGFIRGPLINAPNPIAGNPEGIVCGSSIVDTALFNRFVRINDTRDPNLQGPLTVQGTVTFAGPTTINNNMTVTGSLSAGTTTIGACARILATTGRAGFGCANPNDLPAGYTGGVRSPDVVASGRILASDNPAAFTGNNTNYVFAGVQGGVAEMRTSGRAAADRLTPLGAYAQGAVCAAADVGSIARNIAGTGLVYCQGGRWMPLATAAVAGGACAPDGAMATAATNESLLCVGGAWRGMGTIIRAGAAGAACAAAGVSSTALGPAGEALLCKINPADSTATPVYYRMSDVTTQLSFVRSIEVTHGQVVDRPNCTSPAPFTRGIIQLIPKVFSSSNGGVDIRVLETLTTWTARLTEAGGVPMPGSAIAVAQVFCYFP